MPLELQSAAVDSRARGTGVCLEKTNTDQLLAASSCRELPEHRPQQCGEAEEQGFALLCNSCFPKHFRRLPAGFLYDALCYGQLQRRRLWELRAGRRTRLLKASRALSTPDPISL